MKVQFDERRIRVRLGKAEFAALCAGAPLSVSAGWATGTWSFAIGVGDAFTTVGEGGNVQVMLPRADLEALSARLPAKDGLTYAIDGPCGACELTVEVDLHDGRARAR